MSTVWQLGAILYEMLCQDVYFSKCNFYLCESLLRKRVMKLNVKKGKKEKKSSFSPKSNCLNLEWMNEAFVLNLLVLSVCLLLSARILWRDVLVSTQRSVLPWNKCGGTHGWIQALWSCSHSVANHRCTEYLQWNQVLAFSPRWHKTLQPTNGCFTYLCGCLFYACDRWQEAARRFYLPPQPSVGMCRGWDYSVSEWAPKGSRDVSELLVILIINKELYLIHNSASRVAPVQSTSSHGFAPHAHRCGCQWRIGSRFVRPGNPLISACLSAFVAARASATQGTRYTTLLLPTFQQILLFAGF